ncbi:MAG: SMP-30/gluconolactonase/LRE family protein [Deltaproteobacteria bacterium]|nr:SMP-30/gluconolactonase/LRE family protein [Deltaproteobacteria bacterium]
MTISLWSQRVHLAPSLVLLFTIGCAVEEGGASQEEPDGQAPGQGGEGGSSSPGDNGGNAGGGNTGFHDAGPGGSTPPLQNERADASLGGMGGAVAGPASAGIRKDICGTKAWVFTTEGIGRPELVAQSGDVNGNKHAFTFLEGPVWRAADATLLFSDFNTASALNSDKMGPPSLIWQLGTDGVVKPAFAEGSVRANGMAIDDAGNILVADHGVRGISRIAKDGKRATVTDNFENKAFNAPNDLATTSDGSVYFTDPTYNGQVDGRETPIGYEGVYRVAPDGQVQLIDRTLKRPNGITVSLDEKWLYVSSKDESTIYRYPLTSGAVGPKQPFITGQPTDGVTLDCAGNLYLAVPGKALRVFDPQGKQIWETLSRKPITNVAFGGPQHNVLYVTEQTGLHRIQMVTPGLPY